MATVTSSSPGLGRVRRQDLPFIDARDFGARVGTANDYTDEVQAALDAVSGGSVVIIPRGTIYIGNLTVPAYTILRGEGGVSVQVAASAAGSILWKPASATGVGVTLAGAGAGLEYLCVIAEAGGAGDGIQVAAGRTFLHEVSSNGHAGNGIRIGKDDSTNCNSWRLRGILARSNGGSGCYIHSNTGSPADANAGTILHGEFDLNGVDGLRVNNAYFNTFVGILTQQNAGYGINCMAASIKNTFLGGDQNEGNTTGQIYNAGNENQFFGVHETGFTDAGGDTVVIGQTGSRVKGLVSHAVSSATTQTPITVQHAANTATGRGVGVLFRPPNGSGLARDGAIIAAEQESTNRDLIAFSANLSGVMTRLVEISPWYAALMPPADLTIALGHQTRRFSDIWGQRIGQVGAFGQQLNMKHATAELTALSGATATATNLIPAGAFVVGVSVRVTLAVTGATTFQVGDGTDPDKWGATVAIALNTTTTLANATALTPTIYPAATSVVLTANGSNFTAGSVRVTVNYLDITAATS